MDCIVHGVAKSQTYEQLSLTLYFPSVSAGEESARNSGDLALIPGLGRSPGEENGNPTQ